MRFRLLIPVISRIFNSNDTFTSKLLLLRAAARPNMDDTSRAPVLVELFTSRLFQLPSCRRPVRKAGPLPAGKRRRPSSSE